MALFQIKTLWEPAELVRFLIRTNIVLFVTALVMAPEAVNVFAVQA